MLLCISAMTFLTRTASGGTSAPCRGLDCGITRIAAIILISVRSLRPPFHRISYVFYLLRILQLLPTHLSMLKMKNDMDVNVDIK